MEEKGLSRISGQERARKALTCLLGALLFYMSFYMTFHLVYELSASDLTVHFGIAKEITVKKALVALVTGDNLMWHILVKALRKAGIGGVYCACMVSAGAITATYAIACRLFGKAIEHLNRALIPVAAFVMCLVGPLYMPWYNYRIYRGQDSPNPWHSPTQIMVKPFALLIFWMTIRIYQRCREGNWPRKAYESRGEAALYTILITLSVYAKPSFFQAIVPALGLLMIIDLIRSRGKSFLCDFKVAAAYIPGAILTVMKFVDSFFTEAENGMEIAFLAVWSHNSTCIPLSILLLYGFPLFVMIVDRKRFFKQVDGQLSLSMIAVSGAMYALLAETGERRYHGNFSWAWGVTAFLVWSITLKEFLHLMSSDELSQREYNIAAYGGWTLLGLHLMTGIVYFVTIVTGTAQC